VLLVHAFSDGDQKLPGLIPARSVYAEHISGVAVMSFIEGAGRANPGLNCHKTAALGHLLHVRFGPCHQPSTSLPDGSPYSTTRVKSSEVDPFPHLLADLEEGQFFAFHHDEISGLGVPAFVLDYAAQFDEFMANYLI
jgi:hypothetical protein